MAEPGGCWYHPRAMADLRKQDDMPNPSALLCLMIRVLRPCRGTHTTAFGYFRELVFELRRNRSRRVRRYVHLPYSMAPTDSRSKPPIPAPRRSADDESSDVPSPAHSGEVSADLVRGYYLLQEERRRAESRRIRGNHLGSIVVGGVA